MVKIVTVANKRTFEREMNAMFEERKLVFVDLLKWNLPVTGGRYEIDEFDDDAAIYLLMSRDDGSHLGSMRLLRTDRPHILSSFFGYLCADDVPAASDALEVTRLCLSPRLRASERRWVRDRLISALADYALSHEIRTLTGVARTSWLSQIVRMGWRCDVLGDPQLVDGAMTGAFRIHVDADTTRGLGDMGIYVPGTIAPDQVPSRVDAEPTGPRLERENEAAPVSAESAQRFEAAEFWVARLLDQGFCIIPDAISTAQVEALNSDLDARFAATPFCEGGFYGPRTKRFGSLLKRSPAAAEFIAHPLVLAITEKVLGPWCDRFNLNLSQGIEIHPGAPAQFPHRDQDMWRGEKGRIEYLVNVMWPLSDFTAENGATRIWPGSHHPGALDMAPHDPLIAAEMSPGSVLLFLGSTLHAAGGNYASSVRRGLIVSYCLGWLKPFENQWLCYPPEIARRFAPELARLVGYSQHRPNLGNYEGQCPSILLRGDPPDYIAAADALRPDQQAELTAFMAEQSTGRSRGGSAPADL
jgi:N-acyl-L-homoserine lactone synthetase/ectoine hydroxylase-related dioxygenase (phytanoyl-CoA dioxygenase family)